jgi:primase-polymerase (primpol)-like protein
MCRKETKGVAMKEKMMTRDRAIPAALKDLSRWVVWKYEQRDGKPKPTKVPYDAKTGKNASCTDPSTWTTFKKAVAVRNRYSGIGFVLTDADDIAGVDLDHCLNPETGVIEQWALDIIKPLNSYTEISPSGTGIRIFMRGTLPPVGRKKGQIEFYDDERYLTVTGHHLAGTPLTIEDRQETLQRVHAVHFPPPSNNGKGQQEAKPITADDETQLNRMFNSKNGATIKKLYDGEWSELEYPSQSEADSALCCHLAFWFAKDTERMDRLFRQSKLMRPKWDSKRGASTYGAQVIARVCALVTETYSEQDAELDRLAALPPLEYGKVRNEAAKRLGVTVSILDQEVKKRRQTTDSVPDFVSVDPAESPVEGEKLADALATVIRRFVVIEPDAIHATVLWVLWAYAFNCWTIAPILALVSPEKRCGKTSLLALLARVLDRALLSSNISAAAIFRAVDGLKPVLLIDEMDSFGEEDEALRGILNSGHTKDAARVIRVVGEGAQMTVKTFSTWCPKVLASIGALADTLEDRSITIPMKRRKRGEAKESLRWTGEQGATLNAELRALASQCKRWAADQTDVLTAAAPTVPPTLNDRAADNWYPLFCVAEVLGQKWRDFAQVAALKLSGVEMDSDSIRIHLLGDIRTILKGRSNMPSLDLCTALINLLDSPWREWKRGNGITPSQLARQLKPFGVSSRNLRLSQSNNTVAKGYETSDFQEAFERYLPPEGEGV